MNRRILALVIAGLVLVAGAGLFVLIRPRPTLRPAPVPGARAAREPSPATPGAPLPTTRPETAPRPARRTPGSTPAAPAAPAGADAAPELGTLRIEADVPNAQVFLDRQFVGTAPVTADRLKPGTHQLNVSAEGFDGIARTIDVEPGPRDVAVRFREVRLNATLAVVHKHRIGSCMGQLVATTQGLRYDTGDKGDQFTAPLADLETFVVDYQDKNLKIKLRKGRQYNFTDPDGNADRLFAFQRDVDKVRQRLAKGDAPASN
ncbi:MAG TPA: PEGA domain-containing protein [Vicinamibacterales bacterium]|nr:PEGA domain-containing protein [Vicinamibacterales bacterium]